MGVLNKLATKIKSSKFKKGTTVIYKSNSGREMLCVVLGKSKDGTNGLRLKNKQSPYQEFYIPGNRLDNITKYQEPEPQVEPQVESTNTQTENTTQNQGLFSKTEHEPKRMNTPTFKTDKSTSYDDSNNLNYNPRSNYEEPNNPGKFLSEILILVALGVHLVDIFFLNSSIDSGPIAIRTAMYLSLVTVTILLTGGYNNFLQSFKEHGRIAAIPVIIIPLIGYIARIIGAPPEIIELIAGFALLLPIYAFYLLNRTYLDTKLIGDTKTQRFFSLFILPSGWIRIFIAILFVAIMSQLIVMSATTIGEGSQAAGIIGSGFDSSEVMAGAIKILVTPIQKVGDFVKKVGPTINSTYVDLYNQTLGAYYVGEIEDNKELTGVFINDFRTMGTYYEENPVELYAIIKLRSFVDNISLSTHCYAQDLRNTSKIIPGKTEPKDIHNVFRNDYISVRCSFDNLTEGRYDITFVTEFNFETWAYITLTLMEREFLYSLYANQINVHQQFNIIPRTRTIFTNGPVMLGMNDGMEMPIALSTDRDTNIPLGLTIDDRQQTITRGQIKSVESFQIRAPKEFSITEENCIIPGNGKLTIYDDPLVEGYKIYKFNVSHKQGVYTTVSCNSKISSNDARVLLQNPAGKQEITIAGSTTYDYVLTRRQNIQVRKFI